MYPDMSRANAYEFLAEARLPRATRRRAAAVLTDMRSSAARSATLKKLASLEEELGDQRGGGDAGPHQLYLSGQR